MYKRQAQATKAVELAEAKATEIKRINEAAERNKVINGLIEPLSKDQRDIMTDLLESVQTSKLDKSFNKYLSAVIDGNAPAKKKAKLVEGTEITGNRKTNVSSKADENVVDIRRLAGLN